ncbi:MAG: metallopeptidase [Thermoprotei archaeon]|nr:MAG: metallopeptidase [Thermoprotei archaeon]
MRVKYYEAEDVKKMLKDIVETLGLYYIDLSRVRCVRSKGSRTYAYARIHGLPRIWQHALKIKAHYIIEVISENFDALPKEEKIKVLIHELLHIPRSFSGGLRPHKRYIEDDIVEKLYRKYLRLKARTKGRI